LALNRPAISATSPRSAYYSAIAPCLFVAAFQKQHKPRSFRGEFAMRRLAALGLAGLALAASTARGQQTFPYKAYISGNDVYVRSGPGQTYYPTDRLSSGEPVEVYRHDPGGWYAIRPPGGSFSWVSGRHLELKGDGLAVVTEENLATRVGSRFSDIRDVVQVRLHKGEVVEVLGQREGEGGSDGRVWYKIAPPSGEFRWVFGKYVDPEYPVDGLRRTTPEAAAAPRQQPDAAPPAGPIAAEPAPAYGSQWQSADQSYGAGNLLVAASTAARTFSPEEFEEAVRDLDVELSAMVVEEPTVWSFERLQRRAEALLDQAQTAVERGRARLLLSRIERFADIKERHDRVLALREATEETNRRLSALQPDPAAPPGSTHQSARFDGVGVLTAVASSRPGAPRYALVDARGEVQCYVTPAPGVQLQHHVGRRVGVAGTRGYMPEQRALHVMARHVRPLDASGGALR
jgi:uncharacterized protein YraI